MPTNLRYILLARHGAVDRNAHKPDKDQSLKDAGRDIQEVATSLSEHLSELPENERIVIGEIWHGSYRQVRETAGILCQALERRGMGIAVEQVVQKEALDPEQFWRTERLAGRRKVGEELLAELEGLRKTTDASQAGANAILVVGHAPHLGWIAEAILRHPTAIARAELVCIAISDHLLDKLLRRDRWLLWTIAATDNETTGQLREKIESKKQLAGVLGGVITGLLVFLLGIAISDVDKVAQLDSVWRTCIYLSLSSFLVALGLYLATLYAYDRLLMPVRFWAESARLKDRRWLVRRPPSSATWVLYQNMIRVWNWMFTPATWAVVLGILFLAAAVFHPDPVTALVAVGLLVLFAGYYRYFRPTLGTED